MTLAPLRCPNCDAPVPLADAKHFSCPYCRAHVDVPARYRELFEVQDKEMLVRHELEQRFAAAARPPARRVDVAALALVLLGPAFAATLRVLLSPRFVPELHMFVFVIVPALLPGTLLGVWSAAWHATIVRFQLALGCDPPDREHGPPRCRECGAPLAVQPGAISARCAYCGTDSLLVQVAAEVKRLTKALRAELRTLGEAITALELRRRLVVGGSMAAVALLGGLVLEILSYVSRR